MEKYLALLDFHSAFKHCNELFVKSQKSLRLSERKFPNLIKKENCQPELLLRNLDILFDVIFCRCALFAYWILLPGIKARVLGFLSGLKCNLVVVGGTTFSIFKAVVIFFMYILTQNFDLEKKNFCWTWENEMLSVVVLQTNLFKKLVDGNQSKCFNLQFRAKVLNFFNPWKRSTFLFLIQKSQKSKICVLIIVNY